MKIWISKNSEVSVHEQLVTQITLGIASQDLKIGEKLPSTRELARRFSIHQNTVSSAFRELAENGWVEMRQGSGVYVCESKNPVTDQTLDNLIQGFLREAKKSGFTLSEIQKRLRQILEIQPPDHFLVIESDENLRKLLIEEIRQATNWKTFGISLEEFERNASTTGAQLVALFDEKAKIRSNQPCIFVKANSAAHSLMGQRRPNEDEMIAIVSIWDKFLFLAKTMLVAAKIDPETLILRSLYEPNWKKATNGAWMIIADSIAAKEFGEDKRLRPFRIISEESILEIAEFANGFGKG